jgi:hypothetical protein
MKGSLAVRLAKKLAPQRIHKSPSVSPQVASRDSSEKFASIMDCLFVATFGSNVKTAMRQFLGDFLANFRLASGITVHMRAQDDTVDVLGPLMSEVKDGRFEMSIGELPAVEDSNRILKLVANLDGFKDVYMEQ